MADKMTEDSENYYKMVEPFANKKSADKAIRAYFAACHDLRQKLGLPDVHIIIKCDYMDGDKIVSSLSRAHDGNLLESVTMCAWSLNQDAPMLDEIIQEFRQ